LKICIPITAPTTADALRKMKKGFGLADMVELRIDGIRDIKLELLLTSRKGEILVTNRVKTEGGGFAGTERARVNLLKKAVVLGCDFVDLEIRTNEVLRDELKQKIEVHKGHTRLILSYHNFEKTPEFSDLRKKMEEGRRTGADIIKIVPFAEKMEDNLKVLALIPLARKRNLEIITFCMGAFGKISRIMAPFLGSYLTYASLGQGEESAPGQIKVQEFRQIFRILEGEG
jgi:3-dehydroquinate dehydratase type I